jgi:hypothetical protein
MYSVEITSKGILFLFPPSILHESSYCVQFVPERTKCCASR